MGRASRRRRQKQRLQIGQSAAQQKKTEEKEVGSDVEGDVKSQVGNGETRLQQAGFQPFVHVDNTTNNVTDTPATWDLRCTAPECTRQLGLIALMRRLGLGPEQEQYKYISDPTWGMGPICACYDVRVTALQKAATQVLNDIGHGTVADVPHGEWYKGPRTGIWNDVKQVAKRILKHKRQCRKRKSKSKMNNAGTM